MSRRMIDPQVIIKSQVVDDGVTVDLNEILEKYGFELGNSKSVTLQFYNQETEEDDIMIISCDTGEKGSIVANTAVTISKNPNGDVFIRGLLVDNLTNMNLIKYVKIPNGDYENGIMLLNTYEFDVHVIKV